MPVIIGVFGDFHFSQRRGTRFAKGVGIMNTIAKTNPNTGCKPALSSDWVDAHADYLFNFAVGQLRDVSAAEDLVQETFLAAVKSPDSFSGKSSERTWLVGILRHKMCDHLRKTCRERAVRVDTMPNSGAEAWEESALWLHDMAAESRLPSRRLELDELHTNLEIALGKLPPRIAQVFQLYEVEECSNREVCERLNITESNLWVMLHRGRKLLREQLCGWWFGDKDARTIPEVRINA